MPRFTRVRRPRLVALAGATLVLACGDRTPEAPTKAESEPTARPGSSAALDATIGALLGSLASDDDEAREKAVAALTALGPAAIGQLAKGLDDPNEAVRQGVVEVLTETALTEAVPPLLKALQDKSWEVRMAAAEALGKIRDARAVEPLMKLYGSDDDAQVRYECLTSLGTIGDPRPRDLLVQETASSDPYVRMRAMEGLCRLGDGRAPGLAVSLLKDPNPYVRRQVVQACEKILATPDGNSALIDVALHDDDAQAAGWARRFLAERVRSRPPGTSLAGEVREAARQGLRGAGAGAVRAALVLGELGDAEATDTLIEALGDPDPLIRHHAAYLLAKVRDPRVVPALIRALDDEVSLVRATAHSSLRWYADDGDRGAREALDRYQGDRFNDRLPR